MSVTLKGPSLGSSLPPIATRAAVPAAPAQAVASAGVSVGASAVSVSPPRGLSLEALAAVDARTGTLMGSHASFVAAMLGAATNGDGSVDLSGRTVSADHPAIRAYAETFDD